ncbi:MAG: TonB dep Rec protein, partial [Acidobacteria bacterium]|nr:TonB dep Rec protein [Acidobacteriota bacterium]
GRTNVEDSLLVINAFRASLTPSLPPISPNLLRLDPYRSVDIRMTKVFRVQAQHRLELSVEAFNLTNHVNYSPTSVNRNLNSPEFLERRNARDARQIQWGLRYSF